MSEKTIITMMDWIERNLTESPSLEKMAAYVGYSSFYCSSQFHAHTGVPFQHYVRRRKLQEAAALLIDSRETILHIALRYGFSSHEAFTRAFCREYGKTPSRFRFEERTQQAESEKGKGKPLFRRKEGVF